MCRYYVYSGLTLTIIVTLLALIQTAEAGGHLCRDEGIHGLLFYPNRFPEFAQALEHKTAGGS